MERDDHWLHLLEIARRVTQEYSDAIFIGGVAVFAHASMLGTEFEEASHDADMYLSLTGKAAMRDRYELRRNPNLGKDSAIIAGEDVDVYVERQHPLGVSYEDVANAAEERAGIRIAALEHLLILKLDAARDRMGSGKGEKDVRDIARIVALLYQPRRELLDPLLDVERCRTLTGVISRPDLTQILGLDPHRGSRLRTTLRQNLRRITGEERSRGRSL